MSSSIGTIPTPAPLDNPNAASPRNKQKTVPLRTVTPENVPEKVDDIRVVIFDMGGVIAGGVHGEVIKDFAPTEPDRQRAEKVARKAWSQFKLGEIEEQEFWELICSRVDIMKWIPDSEKEEGIDTDADLLAHLLRKYHITVYYEAVAMAIRCKRNGYDVGVLSNHAREWIDVLFDRYRLYDVFDNKDLVVISCDEDVRAAKPDPKIYDILLKKIRASLGDDLRADQVVFLDDKLPNVEAAAQAGIRGVHFNMRKHTIKSLKKELQKLGCQFDQ